MDAALRDRFYRLNKWGVRIIRTGGDNDSAHVVKCMGFPNEVVIARAMWPTDANNLVNEHNDALAKALFDQDFVDVDLVPPGGGINPS